LKNAAGADSPQAVAQAISDLAADWLTAAGVRVPLDPAGHAAVRLEVSPLYALDAEELAARVDRALHITGPTYFHQKE
jgi:UDP-N-acetylglucosamine/UDP-N-acetylgalactosamine diphosphorylase